MNLLHLCTTDGCIFFFWPKVVSSPQIITQSAKNQHIGLQALQEPREYQTVEKENK